MPATTGTVVPETFINTMFYDSLDRLVLQVDNAGRATDIRYDSLGRTVAVADANGPDPDARSLPRRAYGSSPSVDVNDFGNVTLTTYDAAGRTLKEESLLTSSTTGDGVHIGRSTTGQALTLPAVDASQGGDDGKITVTYDYGVSGQLLALTDDNGNTTEWTYDVHGRKLSETKGLNNNPPATGD